MGPSQGRARWQARVQSKTAFLVIRHEIQTLKTGRFCIERGNNLLHPQGKDNLCILCLSEFSLSVYFGFKKSIYLVGCTFKNVLPTALLFCIGLTCFPSQIHEKYCLNDMWAFRRGMRAEKVRALTGWVWNQCLWPAPKAPLQTASVQDTKLINYERGACKSWRILYLMRSWV